MSTAIAQPAINTLLQLGNGASPEVYATVANVGSITGPGMSAQVVDVTSHSSGTPWREKITTLLDNGDLTFDVYFIPSDAGHKLLLSTFTGRLFSYFQIQFPDPGHTQWQFTGYISKFSTTEPVDNVIKAALTRSEEHTSELQ